MLKFLTTSFLTAVLLTGTAAAKDFKWASQTDPQTMDPHATNSAPVLGFLNNVYEGLVRRDQNMVIEGEEVQAAVAPVG